MNWKNNLVFLSGRAEPWSRALATALEPMGPGPDLGLRNRSGAVLPGVVSDGRPRALVSTFDAAREAERWAQPGGTVAVFGGGGVDAARALETLGVRLIMWVEPRLEVWRSLMTWEDWTVLANSEWIPVTTPRDLGDVLSRRYHPLWDGGFRSLEWRGATTGVEALWDGHRQAARVALDDVASDASTQARFAERWYRNTLVNLRDLTSEAVDGFAGAKTVVAGAGPGLDDALADGTNRRWLDGRPHHGGKLLATDTALPALTARGLVPDLVFSLDGQLATYQHFVAKRPSTRLVADIASLPLLSRLGVPVVRYLTGHPFSAVVRRFFPELPTLSAPGGHVSALAWNASHALGAGETEAWGVDFAYRDGQAYARGTYVYDVARRSGRVTPLETLLGALCYGAEGRERHFENGRAIDTTPRLRDYRRRWPPGPPDPATLAHDSAGSRWPAFASDWKRRLEALPLPHHNGMQAFVRTLPDDVRQDWLALWPLALALYRQGAQDPREVIDRAQTFL